MMGQERAKVALTFLPPPLETATYSLGIYEAKSHKLVRRLHEFAPGSAFTTGLNGFITSWDGKDDDGKAVPPGRYAAQGYAVGAMKVEGKAILGNDWASDDENLRIARIVAMALVPGDNGLVIVGLTPDNQGLIARYGGSKCELLWQRQEKNPLAVAGAAFMPWGAVSITDDVVAARIGAWNAACRLADGTDVTPVPALTSPAKIPTSAEGKDGTSWRVEEGVLAQYSPQGELLRNLASKKGEPEPVGVVASKTADRLFLLDEGPLEGSKEQQRVRGLSWKDSTKEGDKTVSNWTTFFVNAINRAFLLVGADNTPLTNQVEITLVENPLSPGKPERLKLAAAFDAKGSYLATADGLRLRQISQRPSLRAVKLAKNKAANALTFYQYDGAAWDEFAIEGAREMMSFDAGEIELTATGEKPNEKAAEPDL